MKLTFQGVQRYTQTYCLCPNISFYMEILSIKPLPREAMQGQCMTLKKKASLIIMQLVQKNNGKAELLTCPDRQQCY